MMARKVYLLLLFSWFTAFVFAQESLTHATNRGTPIIHPDRRVTFQLHAPEAKSVLVTGDCISNNEGKVRNKASLKKSESGTWEYTTSPLTADLYYYYFLIDGVRTVDPNNAFVIRDVSTLMNLFLIEGGQGDLYKVNQVPHGSLTHRWYNSPTLQKERRITIYTPPGYEESKQEYPVLYLLHGKGGDEMAWITLGRCTQIMDNLIAQRKAVPMLVVLPNGNVSQEAAPGESTEGFKQPTFELPLTMEGSMEKSFPDIIEFIERNYRVKKGKAYRAIAGLSMGGYHSFHIAKEYPTLFNYIGLFSAAILPKPGVDSSIYKNREQKLALQFSNPPKLFWIGIGKEDFLYNQNVELRETLDKNHFPYTYYESEGGHTWKNWRKYLSIFVPQLFQHR